jgi:hypothetical protein
MSKVFLYQEGNGVLPSLGLPYGDAVPAGRVTVDPFLIGEQIAVEKIMGSKDAYLFFRTVLGRLLKSPADLDLDSLLLSDVYSLLYGIKQLSFGSDLPLSYKCPCGVERSPVIKINELLVRNADEVEKEFGQYKSRDLYVKTQNHDIKYHLPTLADERKVQDYIRSLKKSGRSQSPDGETDYIRTAILIDELDGNTELGTPQKYAALTKFTLADGMTFDKHMVEHDTGFVPDQMSDSCTNCGHVVTINPQITPEFFRPAAA